MNSNCGSGSGACGTVTRRWFVRRLMLSTFCDSETKSSYWCVVSALVPYKRVELAVEWANRFERPLIVVGEGPEQKRLEQMAGPTVQLRGRVSREEIRDVFAGALGLVFPGSKTLALYHLKRWRLVFPLLPLVRRCRDGLD